MTDRQTDTPSLTIGRIYVHITSMQPKIIGQIKMVHSNSDTTSADRDYVENVYLLSKSQLLLGFDLAAACVVMY